MTVIAQYPCRHTQAVIMQQALLFTAFMCLSNSVSSTIFTTIHAHLSCPMGTHTTPFKQSSWEILGLEEGPSIQNNIITDFWNNTYDIFCGDFLCQMGMHMCKCLQATALTWVSCMHLPIVGSPWQAHVVGQPHPPWRWSLSCWLSSSWSYGCRWCQPDQTWQAKEAKPTNQQGIETQSLSLLFQKTHT